MFHLTTIFQRFGSVSSINTNAFTKARIALAVMACCFVSASCSQVTPASSPTPSSIPSPAPVATPEAPAGCIPSDDGSTDFRAIHMGGNWGTTRNLNYADPLPRDYLAYLHRVNANWIGISVAIHVDGSLDATVERRYSGTEIPTFSDYELITLVDTLHANSCKVFLTLAFDFDEPADPRLYRWQLGDPDMTNEDPFVLPENWPWSLEHPQHESFVASFWTSYAEQAVYFAEIAERTGVEMFSLGTETERLFRSCLGGDWPNEFGDELRGMVKAVRDVYSGKLTYDQHYGALTAIDYYGPGSNDLWEDLDLDVVGISAYFPLLENEPEGVPDATVIEASWELIFAQHLLPLQQRNPGKPILFLEFGYADLVGSALIPNRAVFSPAIFTDTDGNGLDDGEEAQALILDRFYAVNDRNGRLVKGTFLWGNDWSADDIWSTGPGQLRHMSIRDHLAESVVAGWYGRWIEPTR